MTRLRNLGVAGLLLLAIGLGTVASAQHGSFTASLNLNVAAPNLAFTLEQQIGEVSGWTIYAGTGFAVRPFLIERFDPFTSACRELDLFVAYSELCVEARIDFTHLEQSAISSFLTTVW